MAPPALSPRCPAHRATGTLVPGLRTEET